MLAPSPPISAPPPISAIRIFYIELLLRIKLLLASIVHLFNFNISRTNIYKKRIVFTFEKTPLSYFLVQPFLPPQILPEAIVAISVKMSRCQDDIFPRIELIPSFVLSSDNTNCKNDIQLFHQLFDELSVHTDYH